MNKANLKKYYNNEKGISFVELVVAVSIFSLVMIAAVGIFINAMKAQKVMLAKQNVAENLRYISDFMIKELRMAQVDSADPDLTFKNGAGIQLNSANSPSSTISFINSAGSAIEYSLSSSPDSKIMRKDISGLNVDQPLSSDDIRITGLSFVLNNWSLDSGGNSPFITLLIKAESKNGASGEIEFQTGVSPRTY